MRATIIAAATDSAGWSGADFAVRFGAPALVVLVGMVIFLGGRSERHAARAEAAEAALLPPGEPIAEGAGALRTAQVQEATRKVLIGLVVMLVGSLTLLGVTFWGILT